MATINLRATNAAILDAIRAEASSQYQARVPAATQGDIAESVGALQTYRPLMNEFVDALINRIGDVVIRSKIWNNPLAPFKRGMMPYGATIEEIYVGLLEAKRYDPNSGNEDVFASDPPDIKTLFHSLNRQDMYKVTVNEDLLKRAFVDEYGLQTLVGSILDQPYNSDYWDEYLVMKNLFTEYAKNDQYFKVQVPDMSTSTDLNKDMKACVRSMREMANMIQFMSPRFNASNIKTFTAPEDMYVFINPQFEAAMDVDVLASAFNMDKAEYLGRRVLIDDFGIAGCQAILADRNFFMCADTKIQFASIYNPKGLSWNYFLHHWGIYSMSKFVNAIMFTTEVGTDAVIPVIALTGLTLTIQDGDVDYATVGSDLPLSAVVAGTIDGVAGAVPQAVQWAITKTYLGAPGAYTAGGPLHIGTFVDPEGVLHVDDHETNTALEITAITTYVDGATEIADQTAQVATINVGVGAAYAA